MSSSLNLIKKRKLNLHCIFTFQISMDLIWQVCRGRDTHTQLVGSETGTATLKGSVALASTVKMCTLDPDFLYLLIYPTDIHTHVHKDVRTTRFGINSVYYIQRLGTGLKIIIHPYVECYATIKMSKRDYKYEIITKIHCQEKKVG